MNRILISLWVLALLLTGCQSDGENATITMSSTTTEVLYPVINQKTTVSFHASTDWSASCNANWLTFSPTKGSAGNNTITITTTSTNRTKSMRSATLIISAGSTQQSVTVRQSGDYAVFDQKEYKIGAEGGSLTMTITCDIPEDQSDNLRIAYNKGTDWIHWADKSRQTRAEMRFKTGQLEIDPNTSKDPRTAYYVLVLTVNDDEWIGLDTTYVTQAGISTGYESTDYSADGTVTVMQQATIGKGIPVVLMGDGFADKDIADGTYSHVMEKAMENLFSEEPVKTLRDYFDVYAVTAVSKNDNVGEDYSTVFSCVPDPESSSIDADFETVMRYLKKVQDIDSLNALSIVILNSNIHKGVTYLYSSGKTGKPLQYAAAFCPIVESLESEQFRTVLIHEAIGHGLGKLADEYSNKENGVATSEVIDKVKNFHKYNWMKNVDVTGDATQVDWHAFIADQRYSKEAISTYEGGYTYLEGIFRPTDESMMNSNSSPFNAPSRKALYDRIMLLGEDKESSTYDEFTAFDLQHQPEQWTYNLSRTLTPVIRERFARPVMIKKSNW